MRNTVFGCLLVVLVIGILVIAFGGSGGPPVQRGQVTVATYQQNTWSGPPSDLEPGNYDIGRVAVCLANHRLQVGTIDVIVSTYASLGIVPTQGAIRIKDNSATFDLAFGAHHAEALKMARKIRSLPSGETVLFNAATSDQVKRTTRVSRKLVYFTLRGAVPRVVLAGCLRDSII